MTDIQEITDNKFNEIRDIVKESDSSITGFEKENGWFRLNTKKTQVNFRIIKTVLMNDLNIAWRIYNNEELVYDINVGYDKINFGITEFHKILDSNSESDRF